MAGEVGADVEAQVLGNLDGSDLGLPSRDLLAYRDGLPTVSEGLLLGRA